MVLDNPKYRILQVLPHLDSKCKGRAMQSAHITENQISFYLLEEAYRYTVERSIIGYLFLVFSLVFLLVRFHPLDNLLKV